LAIGVLLSDLIIFSKPLPRSRIRVKAGAPRGHRVWQRLSTRRTILGRQVYKSGTDHILLISRLLPPPSKQGLEPLRGENAKPNLPLIDRSIGRSAELYAWRARVSTDKNVAIGAALVVAVLSANRKDVQR
jgi:hypothetical protein